jgi:hypothetical protein
MVKIVKKRGIPNLQGETLKSRYIKGLKMRYFYVKPLNGGISKTKGTELISKGKKEGITISKGWASLYQR